MDVIVIMNAVKTIVARKRRKWSTVMMAVMKVLMGLMIAIFLAGIFVNGGRSADLD